MSRIAIAILVIGLLVLPAWMQAPERSGLQPNPRNNSLTTSGTNAAVTKSIAAVAGKAVYLYHVEARCSAGTSNLTIKDGVAGTTVWTNGATEVGATNFFRDFSIPLASTDGNGMDIVLAACGTSNTGTLVVQASQF